MAITLADAALNTQPDLTYAVIDDLRRKSALMDALTFDDAISPTPGGGVFTAGYHRLVTAAPASFRAIGSEFVPGQAKRKRFTVDLKVLGGSFTLDRAIANLGPAATSEKAFQFEQVTKSIVTRFQEEVISGDAAVDENGFDGLSKALAGSSTEQNVGGVLNWTAAGVSEQAKAHDAMDALDALLSAIDGRADALLLNEKSLNRIRSIARRAGFYTREETAFGGVVERYGSTVLMDLGYKSDGGMVIPTRADGTTDVYAVRFGLDAFHAYSGVGDLVNVYQPAATDSGAVRLHEVEMSPVAVALKSTRGAAVLRNIKVQG